MINEADITRRFKNLISTKQLVKKIGQHGYQGEYTEQAIYKLLDKYGIKPKTTRGGKSYFNKRNACTCIDRHIFELREIAEQLAQQNQPRQEEPDWNVGYGRDDMSVISKKLLAKDGAFGSDENMLYAENHDYDYDDFNIIDEEIDYEFDFHDNHGHDFDNFKIENTFSFENIVNEALMLLEEDDDECNEKYDESEGDVFIVCGKTQTSDLRHKYMEDGDVPSKKKRGEKDTTFHWTVERRSRRIMFTNFLKWFNYYYRKNDRPIKEAGDPYVSFIVDKHHPCGNEIHTLTQNGFLYVQNIKSKEVITFFIPTRGQVTRYWDQLHRPVPWQDRNIQFTLTLRRAFEKWENKGMPRAPEDGNKKASTSSSYGAKSPDGSYTQKPNTQQPSVNQQPTVNVVQQPANGETVRKKRPRIGQRVEIGTTNGKTQNMPNNNYKKPY